MFHSECREREEKLEKEIKNLAQAIFILDQILFRVVNGLALSATLRFEGDSDMPATINVGGKGAQAVFTEFNGANGTGSPVAPIQPPVFSSSDATIATVDPASGAVTAVAPGSATISASDAGNGLSASDTVTVLPALAVSATLVVTANS